MREILFRGKRIDNGEWVEGGYYETDGEIYILTNTDKRVFYDLWGIAEYVIPETVGRYTGLTANGKKIFEGDILQVPYNTRPYKVYYNECNSLKIEDVYDCAIKPTQYAINYLKAEVIGNIHDNPELLEGQDESRYF